MFKTTQTRAAEGLIDFSVGHPSLSLLPLGIMAQAANHGLNRNDPALLQYGFEQGDEGFRRALGVFLGKQYRAAVEAEQLFVSGGASQGLDLICSLYTRPGDLVFVEEPTYFLALRIFADHGLEVVGIPTDEQGLIVADLEAELARRQPVFLYTIPTHQNPSGATLPLERRRRLLALSKEYEFLIVADEVYHLLSYTGTPPPPMGSLGGRVLSLGSFSKILAPGLRLGWIQAPVELLQPLISCGLLDSGGGLGPFTSGLVRSLLELGLLERHLQRLREVYRDRLTGLCGELQRELAQEIDSQRIRFSQPGGGFFLWIRLAGRVDSQALLAKARELQVGFMPGARCSGSGGSTQCLRLSFSFYEREILEEGARRLGRLLRSNSYEWSKE